MPLRQALETGLRFAKRSFKGGIHHATPRSTSTVQNAMIKPKVIGDQVQPPIVRKFFFAHWLQNSSRVVSFKNYPIERTVANGRMNPMLLFLALVGFTYMEVKENETSGSATCSPEEEKLHRLLQDMLQSTAKNIPEVSVNHTGKKLKDYRIKERLGKASCNSAVYAAEIHDNPCALKMLFNYSASSQSVSLEKAFSKELAVLPRNEEIPTMNDTSRYTRLPNHFNVIKVLGHFADNTPVLSDAVDSYPLALPSRLYRDGYGRNRTMFCVMQKFSGTLHDYIAKHKDNLHTKTSLALLAQLLEGLRHLNIHGVAHRDLKSDNILVNESANGMPHLVITDLGCCLAEKRHGLKLPFETDETSKGGNAELMAPEVVSAEPGPGQIIDYSKSDEWAAGAIGYEIFGQKHPFQNQTVDKESYNIDHLPELKGAPMAVRVLIKELLQRHPNDRPDISLAATVCQMLLWAPDLCMVDNQASPLDNVKRWFERMTLSLTFGIWEYQDQQDIPVEKQASVVL
ncbi:Serine threonine- kinase PINK1, mitochondrial [Paramuricea clavata]|uniref:non-specific serine/threonine protein kinase n=1 Tax=Paramuricea clavata TaxID=317549 RepID=A0A7D9LSD1_PARCT|nr:Serine threonine- kinase PINK1, mitochondrial [Paramuricea clavata]